MKTKRSKVKRSTFMKPKRPKAKNSPKQEFGVSDVRDLAPPYENLDSEIFKASKASGLAEQALDFAQLTADTNARVMELEKIFWENYVNLMMMVPQTLPGARIIINWALLFSGCEDDDMYAILQHVFQL